MTLDMRTLLVLLALSALLMSLTLAIGARNCRGGGIWKWNVGLGLIALGWTLMLGRGNLPDLVTVSAANALLLAGLCAQAGALMELGGLSAPRWLLLAPPPLHFALLLLAQGDFVWMTLLNAGAYVPAFIVSAWLALRLPYAARGVMAGAFGIGAFVLCVRALEVWAGPESYAGLFSESTAQTVTFVVLFMMTLVNPFAFLIMQRARAEEKLEEGDIVLRESEKRYRDLVENSRDLVCTHDLEGNLLSVNEAAVRLSGYARDALLRMNLADLLVPAARASFPAYLAEVQARGVATGLMRVQTAGGELRWWEYHNTLRTADVAVPIVRGMSQDVTERMRAEKDLRDSEARFRTLAEMSSDFYWESDAAHRLTKRASANRKVSTVSVFEQGTQIGQRRWEVPYLSPDEAGWQAHRAVLDAHLPFRDFELSRPGADGSERFIVISGDPFFDGARNFAGYRGVGTDITDRKHAEAELRKLAIAVRQSGTATVITDPTGSIEFVNPKFEAMTGYSASEAIGRNPRFLKSGAQPQEFYRNLWETITAGKEWSGEIQNRKKTGELYWESQHISPVLDDSSRIRHFIALTTAAGSGTSSPSRRTSPSEDAPKTRCASRRESCARSSTTRSRAFSSSMPKGA
jgi:PAS domain S-box-containing protein